MFNVWNLPAVSVQELPSLQSLQLELSKFAYDYLLKSLCLPKPADPLGRQSIAELNSVLWENLVEDRSGSHVRIWALLWGTLDLESKFVATPFCLTKLGSATPCSTWP